MSAFDDSEICRGILENLPTRVCVIDMQKKIVLWSDGAERITGRPRYEVIGHRCIGEHAPLDPANRRISLIVQYIIKNADDEDAKASGSEEKSEPASPETPPEKK
jgi:PAS domain S-box-containing protein